MLSFPMSWLLWLILVALLTLPVALRLYVGEEPDGNAITHESGDDQDPDGMLTAA